MRDHFLDRGWQFDINTSTGDFHSSKPMSWKDVNHYTGIIHVTDISFGRTLKGLSISVFSCFVGLDMAVGCPDGWFWTLTVYCNWNVTSLCQGPLWYVTLSALPPTPLSHLNVLLLTKAKLLLLRRHNDYHVHQQNPKDVRGCGGCYCDHQFILSWSVSNFIQWRPWMQEFTENA